MSKNEEVIKYYGEIMKDLRLSLDMPQTTLSNETGYSIQTISKIENGKAPMGVAWHDILRHLYLHISEETYKSHEEEILFMFNYFYDKWPVLESLEEILKEV